MADKRIGELPSAKTFDDDSLLVVEQSSQALNVSGKLLKTYAETAAVAVVKDSVDAAAKSAADAAKSAQDARGSANEAAGSAQGAEASKNAAEDSAKTAKESEVAAKASETAAKSSEKTASDEEQLAKKWAELAQAQAESMTVPAVKDVYNLILQDRSVPDDRYALIVEDGILKLIGVKNTLSASTPALIDPATGASWNLAVESGKLLIEEV